MGERGKEWKKEPEKEEHRKIKGRRWEDEEDNEKRKAGGRGEVRSRRIRNYILKNKGKRRRRKRRRRRRG